MRCTFAVVFVLFSLLLTGPVRALSPASEHDPGIALDPNTPVLEVAASQMSWVDTQGDATIDTVVQQKPDSFKRTAGNAFYPLDKSRAVWIRLRLQNRAALAAQWTLNIPLPYIDQVRLYQPDGAGGWTAQVAGDSIAVARWPRLGLYPEFALSLAPRATQDVYLQVRNFKAVNVPLRIATATQRARQNEVEYLGLGVLLGSMLMLAAWCGVQALAHRSLPDAMYAGYCLLVTLSLATVTGLASQFLWPQSPQWANNAYGVMPLLAMASSLWVVRHLCALASNYPRFDQLLLGFAGVAGTLPIAYLFFERSVTDVGYMALMALAPLLGLVATVLAWRRKNPAGLWLMLAYAPQGLAVLGMIAQSLDIGPILWFARYLLVGAAALSVPLLLHALSMRLRERQEVASRADHLPTQDALTGLLTPELFAVQLNDVIERALDHKEPAAVVLVDVVNYERIKQGFGDAAAEQCLLRAVIKLHRVLRDVDPAGRVGNARFALIIEGINSRQALSERMVKLIASGLIPLPGLQPEVTLQFHVAAVLLTERVPEATHVLAELAALLSSMAARTRRPIRFLEPELTVPAPLEKDESTFEAGKSSSFNVV